VQARRPEDEELARLIEDMIRNELDRLPMEELNDAMERIVPVNGGAAWLVEWDDEADKGRGAVSVTAVHPKQLCPQNGVYSGIEDMDYIILKIPSTKAYIKERYGKDLSGEAESEPETRETADGERETADDMLTMYRGYYRGEDGLIGVFTWANDTILEDSPNYQARRETVCAKCGTPEAEALPLPTLDGTRPEGGICPVCGSSKWVRREMETETITMTAPGPGGLPMPVEIEVPSYTPCAYPVVLQKNISVYGQLLGESDVEKIRDQQNIISRLDMKIADKLIKSGSTIVLPPSASIRIDSEDGRIMHLEDAASAQEIKSFDFEGNIEQDMAFLTDQYEAARKILGITDSYQGRKDTTANSGVAKQFAAAQSAGRLESRRAMKRAAWSHIFELMFKLRLAYTDRSFEVSSVDEQGELQYKTFSRYKFLRQDGEGGLEWNDDFLFSCDADATLANNRAQRWSDMYNFYAAGTFGNPQDPFSQLLFWQEMKQLHYPGADRLVTALRQRMEQLQAQQQMQMQAQQQMQAREMEAQSADKQRELEIKIDEAARNDAARDTQAAADRQSAAQAVAI
jgi:hypothetical protein